MNLSQTKRLVVLKNTTNLLFFVQLFLICLRNISAKQRTIPPPRIIWTTSAIISELSCPFISLAATMKQRRQVPSSGCNILPPPSQFFTYSARYSLNTPLTVVNRNVAAFITAFVPEQQFLRPPRAMEIKTMADGNKFKYPSSLVASSLCLARNF